MALIYPEYNRILRAVSEVPSGVDFLSRRIIRARSALPESVYEDAYNSSASSRLRREISRVREESIFKTTYDDIPQLIPYPIVNYAAIRASQLRERPSRSYVSRFQDYFRNDGVVHAKITIRHRDDFWKRKYEQDIVNARPIVRVIRPRVIVQRPIQIISNPPPVRIEPIILRAPPRPPITTETVRTTRRITTFTRPSYYHHYVTDYPSVYSGYNALRSYSSSSSSSRSYRNAICA